MKPSLSSLDKSKDDLREGLRDGLKSDKDGLDCNNLDIISDLGCGANDQKLAIGNGEKELKTKYGTTIAVKLDDSDPNQFKQISNKIIPNFANSKDLVADGNKEMLQRRKMLPFKAIQ